MNSSKFIRAAEMVGFRSALVDDTTFVGRKRETSKVLTSIRGRQVTPVWICGARKIGKSSLSFRIPNSESIRTIRMSCDQYEWINIDSLSEAFGKEAYHQLGFKVTASGKGSLSELARLSDGKDRIVLILDEFDRVAINLQQNDQAFLRATLQDNPNFGMVFISRVKPEELLQDFSEENSRLLGICDIIRMPMLNRDEVADLVKVAGGFCGEMVPGWVGSWIYERVGGYPVCVQALLRELLILADDAGSFPGEKEMGAKEYLFFEAVSNDLRNLWRDLPYAVKKVLTGEEKGLKENIRRELMVLNLMENNELLKPSWLGEVGGGISESS